MFLAELDRLPRPLDEDADPVHVTASAVVVGRRGTLLHRHKRLHLWLQPGGHLSPGEDPAQAARRETVEVTGLRVTWPAGAPTLVHVDVHQAARGHTHLDVRYVLAGPDADPAPPPGESPDVRWFSWEEALAVADDSLAGAQRAVLVRPPQVVGGRGARARHRRRRPGPGAVHPSSRETARPRHRRRPAAAAPTPSRSRSGPSWRWWRNGWARSTSGAARCRANDDELGARQNNLEEQIEASRRRRTELEQRMFGGQVTAGRDLQAMDEEVRHLNRHISDLEDRELEVMEALEPLDADLAQAAAERDVLDGRGGALRSAIDELVVDLDAQIDTQVRERTEAAATVPPELLAANHRRRTKLGGTGAARLVGNSCGGCHLTLPAMEVDRIRKAAPDAVITCDQCGRILVR